MASSAATKARRFGSPVRKSVVAAMTASRWACCTRSRSRAMFDREWMTLVKCRLWADSNRIVKTATTTRPNAAPANFGSFEMRASTESGPMIKSSGIRAAAGSAVRP